MTSYSSYGKLVAFRNNEAPAQRLDLARALRSGPSGDGSLQGGYNLA